MSDKPLMEGQYKLAENGNYGLDIIVSETPRYDLNKMAVYLPIADGGSRDGVGDIIRIEGIDTTRHRLNPLCLFDHGKNEKKLPIGFFQNRDSSSYTFEKDLTSKTAGGWSFIYQGKKNKELPLEFTTTKAEFEHAVFAEQCFDMWVHGLIRGGSIGYQVKMAREIPPDYEKGIPQGLDLMQTLMLEGSMVILPANMYTVKSLDTDLICKLCRDGVCCGKRLDPILVKSLERVKPPEKEMVSLLINTPNKKIPPAMWKPGLGAIKDLSILHPEQDAYRSLITFDSPMSHKLKALYHVKSLRSKYKKKGSSGYKGLREDLKRAGIDARFGDVQSWDSNQIMEVQQWLQHGGQEPEVLINLPHVEPDHTVQGKGWKGKVAATAAAAAFHALPDRGEKAHSENVPFKGPSGRWFVVKKGKTVPYKKDGNKGATKKVNHPKVSNVSAKTKEELKKVDKLETEATSDMTKSNSPPEISKQLREPGATAYVVRSRIAGVIPKVGPIHHASVVLCPKGKKPIVDDGLSPKSNTACLSLGLQPGTSTFQIEPQRLNATAAPARADAKKVIERIENFRREYNLLSMNCQHSAVEVTKALTERYKKELDSEEKGMLTRALGSAIREIALSYVPTPLRVVGAAIGGAMRGRKNFSVPDLERDRQTELRDIQGGACDSQMALIKSIRQYYRAKALDWSYWLELASRVLTDRRTWNAIDALPGALATLKDMFKRGMDPQAAAQIVSKLHAAYRDHYPDKAPPRDITEFAEFNKCLDDVTYNGKALGDASKNVLLRLFTDPYDYFEFGRHLYEQGLEQAKVSNTLDKVGRMTVGDVKSLGIRFRGTKAAPLPPSGTAGVVHKISEAVRAAKPAVQKAGKIVGQAYGTFKKDLEPVGHKTISSKAKRPPQPAMPGKIKSLRQKYRTSVKSLRRRLKHSSPGATIVKVHEKDLKSVEDMAKQQGLRFHHMGQGKVKLMGHDEGCDEIARRFGRPLKKVGV